MKLFPILLCLLAPLSLMSQSVAAPGNPSLHERYRELKSGSQTFKEYKVIKETVLDNEWRIAEDSVKAIRKQFRDAKSNIAKLEGELTAVQLTLKQKEESTVKIEHAASHINFFGMDFYKAVFIGAVIIIVAALVVLLVLLTGRLKIMFRVMKEKNETVDLITQEFEEYKHKALDKQTKLSRELQNERNKLQDLKRV